MLAKEKLVGNQYCESKRYRADINIMSDDVSENTGYVGLYSRATVLSDIKQSQNTSGPSLS